MFSYDYLVAAALLTTPGEPAAPSAYLELIQPAFLQLSIDAEILDAREEQFLLGLSKDPAGDRRVLRQRWEQLFRMPSLAECQRFPPRKLIEEFLAFNRAYRMDLQATVAVDPHRAEALRNAIAEVDQLHEVWSTLRDARSTFYYVAVRRQSLQRLVDLVGAEAFYSAQLPPHVPIWQVPNWK